MIDIKIKITGIGCWDNEVPLEFTFEEAAKLYEELGKVFDKSPQTIVTPWHQVVGEVETNIPTVFSPTTLTGGVK